MPAPPGSGDDSDGVVTGPDGNIWFSERGQNTIGFIVPSGTTATEFSNVVDGISSLSGPVDITEGPDGNIWFAEYGNNSIAKFVW